MALQHAPRRRPVTLREIIMALRPLRPDPGAPRHVVYHRQRRRKAALRVFLKLVPTSPTRH
jgi:hypothetical protein